MADTCEHEEAMRLEDSDLSPKRQGQDLTIFFDPECGEYLDEEGNALGFDPTKDEVAETQKKSPRGRGAATTVQAKPANDDRGSMQLEDAQGPNGAGQSDGALQADVPAVPAERQDGELLPQNPPPPPAPRAGKGTGKKISGDTEASLIYAEVLPGPWNNAPCPNLAAKQCPGKIQAVMTLKSEMHGNDYFYRCSNCEMQVVLDFKHAKEGYKQ